MQRNKHYSCGGKFFVGRLLAVLVLMTAQGAQAKIIDITDLGAINDGQTLNTAVIQKAIDQCHTEGGGTVLIPAGRFLTGSVELKSNVELHVARGATLLGSTNPDDFPFLDKGKIANRMHVGGYTALIHALEAENIAITGKGVIDGQDAWLRLKEGPKSHKYSCTRNLLFFSCKKIRVTDVTLQNAGFWMQNYFNCDDVLIHGIRVWNQHRPCNDGIDLDGCRRVTISDCIIDADDDALCFKSESYIPCEDITITNCVLSSFCSAIKMGTGSMGGFKNITISNCAIKPSENRKPLYKRRPPGGRSGVSLEIVDGGVMENISVDNLVMRGITVPIFIRLGNRGAKPEPDAPAPPVGQLRNVSLSNIVAYDTGVMGSSVTGLPGHCAENITLRNIQIFPRSGVKAGDYMTDVDEMEKSYPDGDMWGNLPACGLYIRHVRGLQLDGFRLHLTEADDRVPIWADDVQNLRISQAWVTGEFNKDKPFILTRDVDTSDIEKPHGWTGAITASIK